MDLLINKVFRALDAAELIEIGSLIDTVNRAESRGLITVEHARVFKELRNRIVHQYELDDLASILSLIQENSKLLLQYVARVYEYAD